MLKFIKGLILFLLLAVVLLLALGTVFAYYFDANDYKEQIVSYLETRSGRSIEIAHLDLKLFPSLALDASQLQIGENPNFGTQPFLKVDAVQVGIRVLPLLRQQAQVDGISVDGVRLNVIRNSQGHFNFDDLKASITPQDSQESDTKSNNASALLALSSLDGIGLKNVDVLWDDRLNNTRVAMADLSFESGPLLPNQATAASLKATLSALSGDVRDWTASVTLIADVLPNFSTADIALSDLSTLIKMEGLAAPLTLRATAQHNELLRSGVPLGDFLVDRFKLSYADVVVEGQARLSDLYGQPKAAISVPAFDYDVWQLRQLALEGTMVGDQIVVELQHAGFYQGQISGELTLNTLSNSYQAKVQAEQVPIERVQAALSAKGQSTVRGHAQIQLALAGELGDANQLLKSTVGTADIRISEGALQDESLAKSVESVVAFLEKRRRRSAGEELIFDDAQASIKLNKGIAKNDDLRIQMPLLAIKGAGQIDLLNSEIDYVLHAGLKSRPQTQIPIRIVGDLQDPSYKPNFSGLIQSQVLDKTQLKKKLDETVTEKVDEAKQELEDKVTDKLLKGLRDKLPF